MTDHNYAGCEDPLCQGCDDYSAGYVDGRCSGSRPERLTIREAADVTRCQAVVERLRRRGGAEAWFSMGAIVEPDRERRNGNGMPAVLEAGLGFLPGIELAEGDRSE